jgi:chorismate mutase/prephenate dehydratase
VPPTGRDKTSILFSMKNEPGVLYSILQPFATRGLNLTKIESRPTKRRPWEYVNFLDFEGHCETANVRDVLTRSGALPVPEGPRLLPGGVKEQR